MIDESANRLSANPTRRRLQVPPECEHCAGCPDCLEVVTGSVGHLRCAEPGTPEPVEGGTVPTWCAEPWPCKKHGQTARDPALVFDSDNPEDGAFPVWCDPE